MPKRLPDWVDPDSPGEQRPGLARRTWRKLRRAGPFERHFGAVVVISLERTPERLAQFRRSAWRAGLRDYRAIRARDGFDLDLDAMRSDGRLVARRDGSFLRPGEAGCVLSHRQAWRYLLRTGLPSLLVCEDDAWFRFDADRLLEGVMAELPDDWDMLHLFSSADATRPGQQTVNQAVTLARRQRSSEHVERGFVERSTTVCYALRPRAAARLLEISMPLRSPADACTGKFGLDDPDEVLDHGFKTYVSVPYLCRSRGESTIEGRIRPAPGTRRPD